MTAESAKTTLCGRELGHPITFRELPPSDLEMCARCYVRIISPVEVWAKWPIRHARKWSLWHAVYRDLS